MKPSPEYTKFCTDLTRSFDKDWSKTQLRMDFSFKFLEHIPSNAWPDMVRIAIERWDGWPRNWVKAVKDVYESWRRDAQFGEGIIKYNKDDDVRFPVNLMQRAFRILQEQGYIDYVHYCDSVGMPRTDRERVENKHRICQSHDEGKFSLPLVGNSVNKNRKGPEIHKVKESFVDEIPF